MHLARDRITEKVVHDRSMLTILPSVDTLIKHGLSEGLWSSLWVYTWFRGPNAGIVHEPGYQSQLSVSASSSIWLGENAIVVSLQVKITLGLRDVIHSPFDALFGCYIHDNWDDTSAVGTELVWRPMDAGGCF